METEALKFRSNKMFEAQMFQGDKGPGQFLCCVPTKLDCF
jgi:hypothetical protein